MYRTGSLSLATECWGVLCWAARFDGSNGGLLHFKVAFTVASKVLPQGGIEILFEFVANPNVLNEQQENPLGFATSWKHRDSIKLLVVAGAEVTETVDSGPLRT